MKIEFEIKYNIGDKVWIIIKSPHNEKCPHCNGTGFLNVTTLAGEEAEVRCPKCYDGEQTIYEASYAKEHKVVGIHIFVRQDSEGASCLYDLNGVVRRRFYESALYATKEECEKEIAKGEKEE